MKQPLCSAFAPLSALFVGSYFLVACHSPRKSTAAVLPAVACPQTSEFGNTGCFEVRGQVVGAAGQPLAHIAVDARPLLTRAQFNTPYVMTDSTGQFRVRQFRMFGAAAAAGTPDTLSVYVRATDIRAGSHTPAGVAEPPLMSDSVLVVLTVAPVGKVPTPAKVRITLPVR